MGTRCEGHVESLILDGIGCEGRVESLILDSDMNWIVDIRVQYKTVTLGMLRYYDNKLRYPNLISKDTMRYLYILPLPQRTCYKYITV